MLALCMQEIHGLLKEGVHADNISTQLSPWSSALFEFLPPFIKKQVLTFWFMTFFVSSHVYEYQLILKEIVVSLAAATSASRV